jgi:Stress responsive A/B Barrel Domain
MNTFTIHPISMKMLATLIALAVLFSMMLVQTVSAAPDSAAAKKVRKGKLVHVVSFKFKESATPAQIDEVVKAFGDLKHKISQIHTYEWGTNVSPENHAKGFTHCFLLTFKSDKDRDEYLVHPDHKVFGSIVGKVIADVFVIDYWASK